MTRDETLAAARALVPRLRERSDACTAARSCPRETIDDLKTSGLMFLLQPARFGGSELSWDVFCEALTILAEGCGSQAWVYRVLGDHEQMLGIFPDMAQQDVWGADPSALMSEWLDAAAKRRMDGKPIARSQILQLTAGQAAMEIEAAERIYLPYMVEITRRLSAEETLPSSEAAGARARAAFACQLVLAAVGRLHENSGSAAVYSGGPMERQFRNILTGAQHVGVNWPRAGAALGAQAFAAHGADVG